MTAAYPESLPRPEVDGHETERGAALLRQDVDLGPARQARRFREAPHRLRLRWLLLGVEFAVFEYWFFDVLSRGADRFGAVIAATGGLVPTELRFRGAYTAERVGADLWEVGAEVETRGDG